LVTRETFKQNEYLFQQCAPVYSVHYEVEMENTSIRDEKIVTYKYIEKYLRILPEGPRETCSIVHIIFCTEL
jgi:hypothetical protein